MLKGINPIVSPELLKALCEMVTATNLLLQTAIFLAKYWQKCNSYPCRRPFNNRYS